MINSSYESLVGKEIVCSVTGKKFLGELNGITTNYARGQNGEVYSDEGVRILNQQTVKNNQTVFGYFSDEKRAITGWKGDVMLKVFYSRKTSVRSNWGQVFSIWAYDPEGNEWYGRAPDGCAISMKKTKRKASVKINLDSFK